MRIAGALSRIESLADRVRRPIEGDPLIQAFPGYATPDSLIARGRVLGRAVDETRVISSFRTRELAGVRVQGGGAEVLTDDEGHFTLVLPRGAEQGWVGITACTEGGPQTVLPVLVPRTDAGIGVITDIDDTLMLTGAWSLPRNLWTTLRGRPETRHVFPDAVAMIARLREDGRNPVYYVSSAPWNLAPFLEDVFRRNGLPRGPFFLRDWGITGTHVIAPPHVDHKVQSIGRILDANPGLPFVLVGDTGQDDPSIYLAVARAHPGRIARALFRLAGPRPPPAVSGFAELGIPVQVVADFRALAAAQDE